MIQGINSQNNIPEPYKRDISKVNKSGENVPKFLLGDEEEGVVYEHQNQTANSGKTGKTSSVANTHRSGGVTDTTFSKEKVVYTPSKEAEEYLKPKEEKKEEPTFFQNAIDRIKAIFQKVMNFLWYGEDEKETAEKSTAEQEILKSEKAEQENTEHDASSISKDVKAKDLSKEEEKKIQEYIKKGNTDGVMEVLTRGGTVLPARNTTLLTQYDKHGQIKDDKTVNAGIILKGDKPISL